MSPKLDRYTVTDFSVQENEAMTLCSLEVWWFFCGG